MGVCVQREQTLLVTTELVIWRYANEFIFTNQSEIDFGIGLVRRPNLSVNKQVWKNTLF